MYNKGDRLKSIKTGIIYEIIAVKTDKNNITTYYIADLKQWGTKEELDELFIKIN